jgi:uncharacterized membrane protein YjgN (DUF898 family)
MSSSIAADAFPLTAARPALAPPPEHGPGARLAFSGRPGAFFRMLVRGSLLLIPTFGFYRFWLTTRVRRHLWAHTRLGDEALEYTGTARDLLVGFLVALAVLVPLYLGYALAGLYLEEKQALASLPLVLAMYLLAHFGIYRSRRYLASRTIFRGIRFWMTGSGVAYAFKAMAWDVMNVVTLGLSLPWAAASLERYRMRHTRFGTLEGDFVGRPGTLFRRGFWLWASVLLLPLALAACAGYALRQGADPFGLVSGAAAFSGMALGEGVILGVAVAFQLMIWFLALPMFLAIRTRWRIEGVRFGAVALSSALEPAAFVRPFGGLVLASAGWLVACAIAGGLLFGLLVLAAYRQPALMDSVAVEVAAGVAVALGYLVVLLGFGVLQRHFLGRGLWDIAVNTTAVHGLPALEAAEAAGAPAGSLGEGLADALDVGAGF